MRTLHELRSTFPRPGRVEWLGIRPARRTALLSPNEVEVAEQLGIVGDHGKVKVPRLRALTGQPGEVPSAAPGAALAGAQGKRQVTLIQAEHFPVMAALAGLPEVTPQMLRRNIVVSGLSLLSLKDRRFQLGEVVLEGTGECHPCSRMEENLGEGGYNAVRGHGGPDGAGGARRRDPAGRCGRSAVLIAVHASKPPPSGNALFGFTRLIVEFGVLSSFLFSLILFVSGTLHTVTVIWNALPHLASEETGKALLIAAIEQTDMLLIATALLIISLGLQSLFVGRVINVPGWLHIRTFEDLKQKLLGIVVVALAVKFFSVAIEWKSGESLSLLTFGLGVAAVMLAIGCYSFILARIGHVPPGGDAQTGKVHSEEA